MGGLDGTGHGVRTHRLEVLRPFMMEVSVSILLLHRRAIGILNRDLGVRPSLRSTRSSVPGHLGLLRRTEDRNNTHLYRTC